MSKKSTIKPQSLKKKLQAPSSDSDSSDDVPLINKSYKRNIKDDCLKRFDFLLKQTEIFSHFITGGKGAEKAEEKRGRKKKNAKPSSSSKKCDDTEEGGRRRRKGGRAEDDEVLKGSVAQKSNEIFFDTTPHYIKNGEMRDYQLRGLNWMISLMDNGINGILADEMGLGKTLQTISLLGYLMHFRQNNGPHLVIVPKSTLQNWLNEFKRWCPSLTTICVIGERHARAEYIANVMKGTEWNVCVTSFDMCSRETTTFKSFNWQYLIIDEAHRIKNENSQLAEIVRRFRTTYRLLLTGTPLQNNLHELWALLNFLLPDVFNNSEDFDTWFSSSNLGDQALVGRLHAILKPFLLRRLKSEVETSLLPKKEIKVYVGLSKMQRDWYSKVLLKDIDIVTGCGKLEKMRLAMILMHLRKVTNHPYLFDGAEEGPPYETDLTHLVQNCGKMVILDRLLTRLKEEGSRVLVFSQMTRVLDILEDYCGWRGHKYHRLDGLTPHEQRAVMIDEFNAVDSPTFLFMLSTRAGGLGINLATADSVIIYDSDWNPQADLQAIDRAHRIGQKKQVRVFRLITENTIDEKIVERAEVKLRLDRLVIQKGLTKDQTNPNAIDKTEMLNMIRFGANEILKQEGSNISEEDIDTILKKCESRTQAEVDRLEKVEKEGEASLRQFTLDTISLYQFEGEDWKKKQMEHKAEHFIALPKRQRKLVNYMGMNDGGGEVGTVNIKQPAAAGRLSKSAKSKRAHGAMEPPKPPVQYHDFQFFHPRIFEMAEKEKFYHYKEVGYRIPITVYNRNNSNIARFNARVDLAEPLSSHEVREKRRLMQEGFPTWTRRQFDMFIQGLVEYGEDDMKSVTAFVEGKTLDEVEAYNKVFSNRASELKNYKHIVQMLAAGEEQRLRKAAIKRNLDAKIKSYRQPLLELKLKYPPLIKSKYSADADRFLICMLHRLGLHSKHVYAQLRHIVQTQFYPKTRNDLFLKTRTAMNLHERCDFLISLIQREAQENGGKFVGTRQVPATITGPVVELDSSENEEASEEIDVNSDVVLIDSDSDTPTNGYRKAIAAAVRQKVMHKTRPDVAVQKKPIAQATKASVQDGSSSGEETEVEEVVPVGSSDSEQFDLAEYLAQHGYKSHAQLVKRSLPKSKDNVPPQPKKRKLNSVAAVAEILELDDSSMESAKSASGSRCNATEKEPETKESELGDGKEEKSQETSKSEEKNGNVQDEDTIAGTEDTKAEPERGTTAKGRDEAMATSVGDEPADKLGEEDSAMETEGALRKNVNTEKEATTKVCDEAMETSVNDKLDEEESTIETENEAPNDVKQDEGADDLLVENKENLENDIPLQKLNKLGTTQPDLDEVSNMRENCDTVTKEDAVVVKEEQFMQPAPKENSRIQEECGKNEDVVNAADEESHVDDQAPTQSIQDSTAASEEQKNSEDTTKPQ